MFYSQVILAKKGPLAKVWLAAHWGDKKLARPQIFATDISQSCTDIMNPAVPLALRLSGHLLLGVVRIYSRKVKYVLNDCTEAMLKLQMAFSSSSNAATAAAAAAAQSKQLLLDADGNPIHGGRELLLETTDAHNQLVQNFGEFDRVHVVEGFCLPLPEDNEWILADDEDHDQHQPGGAGSGAGAGDSTRDLLLAAHLPTRNKSSRFGSPGVGQEEEEEEETWAPFDPDNEDDDDDDDDDDDENPNNQSRVSDIEIVRAANDSMLSEDQTRRSSILDVDKSTLTTDSALALGNDNNNNKNEEEEDYDFNVPFGDDSEDEQPIDNSFGANHLNDSDLRLSRETAGTPMSSGNHASGLAMDDDMNDNDDQQQQTKLKRDSTLIAKPRKRRRKRRKVVIDNHETELTNDHIRHMLQETDDIVLSMIHPASLWDDDDPQGNKSYKVLVLQERARQEEQAGSKSKKKATIVVPSLTQPFLQDTNPSLHPKLKQLWKDNYWKALGEPCPYPKQEQADDVEQLRKGTRDDESSREGETSDIDVAAEKEEFPQADPEEQQEQQDDMDFPPAAIDDDDEEEDMDVPVPDFGDEDEALQRKSNADSYADELLDLGMVNDMVLDSDEDADNSQDDDDDENRQALGEMASSSTKWHKHTVRVYKHLQKSLKGNRNSNSNTSSSEESSNLPDSVDFDQLTKHVVSRRNASSIFFEMLQLKTWDFIELEQDESYGKIAISAGVRFGEDAPNN